MSTVPSKPIRDYLRADQIERLSVLAERRNASIADLVREGVDRMLIDEINVDDPLWDIVGVVESGPADLSSRHDDHLAQPARRVN